MWRDFTKEQYKLPEYFGNRVLGPIINQNLTTINVSAVSAQSASIGWEYADHSALPMFVEKFTYEPNESADQTARRLHIFKNVEDELQHLKIQPGMLEYMTNGGEAVVFHIAGVDDTLVKMGNYQLGRFNHATEPDDEPAQPPIISNFVLGPHSRHLTRDDGSYISFVPYLDGTVSEFSMNNDEEKKPYRQLLDKTIECLKYEGYEVTDPKPENWGYSSKHPEVLFIIDIGALRPIRPEDRDPNMPKPEYYDAMERAAHRAQKALHSNHGYGAYAVDKIVTQSKAFLNDAGRLQPPPPF